MGFALVAWELTSVFVSLSLTISSIPTYTSVKFSAGAVLKK